MTNINLREERNKFTNAEKLQILESSIDRDRVNKNSKFNKEFGFGVEFTNDSNWDKQICVSAELYTKEQALEELREYYKEEILGSDYDNDDTSREICDNMSIDNVKFGYVLYRNDIVYEQKGWRMTDVKPNNVHNNHKPIYYYEV